MTFNLNPSELQEITKQILDVLLPAFQKQAQTSSKPSDDVTTCLTVADVAKRLKQHEKTILKRIEEGKLRAANVGEWERPQWRVSETDFTDFYRAHRK